MEGSKRFAAICNEARRERSEYAWSLISKLLAAPRTAAEKARKVGAKSLEEFKPAHVAHG